jgi:hypothetical protein
MGSVGDCFDHALVESFFATLECELIDPRHWRIREEARLEVFWWLEAGSVCAGAGRAGGGSGAGPLAGGGRLVPHGVWDFVYLRLDKVVARSYAEWRGVLDILIAAGLVLLW